MDTSITAKSLVLDEQLNGQLADRRIDQLKQLSRNLRSSGEDTDKKLKIRTSARDFEALMLQQLFATMDKTVEKSGLLGGSTQQDIYQSMLNQEIAVQASKRGGLGIADNIVAQIEGTSPIRRSEHWVKFPVPQTATPPKTTFRQPVSGRISSNFGMRIHPITGRKALHDGIDIAQRSGAPIGAARGGEVTFSGWKEGYGHTVIVQHADGYSSLYAHNLKNLAAQGEYVQPGQAIALVGNSGRSTGSHLHFEIRKDGIPVDPASLLDL